MSSRKVQLAIDAALVFNPSGARRLRKWMRTMGTVIRGTRYCGNATILVTWDPKARPSKEEKPGAHYVTIAVPGARGRSFRQVWSGYLSGHAPNAFGEVVQVALVYATCDEDAKGELDLEYHDRDHESGGVTLRLHQFKVRRSPRKQVA